ncbi:MAG: CcmD family protein [Ignavibacteria bacterium]|nr:CcmD family protein [Ignavibacteria bacterium]
MIEFLSHNSLYIVLTIVMIVWTGIFFFLLNLDNRIKKLEKDSKNEE